MSTFTLDQLASLKKAYARGVLRVREGDTWVEYQSMVQMRRAIADMEAELQIESPHKPRGSRRVRFSQPR
uniref:phage head-tail joining protein n=1 Tax=Marinobacterium profundum TaxID=1714300 RepID=UPI000829FF78|nr:hypothetical protein [Marinobacterium profundum]